MGRDSWLLMGAHDGAHEHLDCHAEGALTTALTNLLMGPKREDEYHDSARGKGEGCHVAAAALGRGSGQQSGYRTRAADRPCAGALGMTCQPSRHDGGAGGDVAGCTPRPPAAPRSVWYGTDYGLAKYRVLEQPYTRTRTAPRAHDRQRDGFCASSREQSINVAPIRHAVYPGRYPPAPRPLASRLLPFFRALGLAVPPARCRRDPGPARTVRYTFPLHLAAELTMRRITL